MSDLIERLRDEEYRGPLQHLRSYSDLDKLHDEAANALEGLRAVLLAMLPEANINDDHCRPGFETCEKARAAIRSLGKEGNSP